METRKDVLSAIRETVEIDCVKVYSNRRKTHMQHKFYICDKAISVAAKIRKVINDLEFKNITVDMVKSVNYRGMVSTNVTIEFPYHTYC